MIYVVKKAFVFLFVFFPFLVSAQDKTLGIMDLSPGLGVSKAEASELTKFVFSAAYHYGRNKYTIIDRDKRDASLDEIDLEIFKRS